MTFKPSQITKQNILDAINKIEHENINLIKATRWQVIINNKPYPPKEVMRLAHEQMNGERIWEYGGGEGTNKFLKKFGFKLIDMQEDSIKKIIEEYKIHIQDTQLNDEKYKWKILSQYKGRPNLDATDFLQELKSINYSNLIYAMGKAVVFHLASEKPIELKEMFRNLFDESIGLSQRIKTFNQEALSIYRSLGEKLQHHQDERTIGTYLTFHNPEKYTFYKNSFYKKMCELLNEREAKKNEKYEHYLFLVNRIIEDYIQDDNELIDLVKTYIPDYYDGSNHLLLTQDILYQMLDKRESVNYWLYAPGENAHKWEEFYENGIMGLGWDDLGDLNNYKTKNEIKKKLQELENVDSSKQNDTAANYEFHKVIKEGDIIIVKKGISELLGYGEVISDYFYDETRDSYQKCREVDWKLKGNWKVDFNLPVKTLTDVTKYPTEDPNYSKYYEKLMAIMESSKAVNHIQDKILNYKAPLNQILYGPPGTGKTYNTVLEAAKIVTGDEKISYDDALKVFNKNLNNQIEFITFHQNYSYEDFIQGLRPDITQNNHLSFERTDGVFMQIAVNALFEFYKAFQNRDSISKLKNIDVNEVYIDFFKSLKLNQEFKTKTKKTIYIDSFTKNQNIIFKYSEASKPATVSSERLLKLFNVFKSVEEINNINEDIRNVIGGCDATVYYTSLREFIGFYNKYKENLKEFGYVEDNYVEEDYVELNYDDVSYERKKELLSKISFNDLKSVDINDVKKYVIIIDEINRANISRVFGELITLIEEDKRSHGKIPMRVTLPSGDSFIVPSNLYIIGTMNTADKSISLLDIALRRRFEFVPMYPNTLIQGVNSPTVLETINAEIIKRKGHDFTIGHAYFMGDNYSLEKTINSKVIPLLLEYFMNDEKEVATILKAADIEVTGWPMQMKTS